MMDIGEITPWSGYTNGRFHVDFLGVRTSAGFFPGLRPAKAGRLRTSLPGTSELLVEYAACLLAVSANRPGCVVLELGAAWGVWTARAAAMARQLRVPLRSVAVEPMPTLLDYMRRHYATNGLRGDCHRIMPVAVTPAGHHAWFKFASQSHLGAYTVSDDWAAFHTSSALAGLPEWLPVPTKDRSFVARVAASPIAEIAESEPAFDFIHIRLNGSPHRMIGDAGLRAARTGMVVCPGLNSADATALDGALAQAGFRSVFAIQPGASLNGPRGPVLLRSGIRIAVGDRVSEAQRADWALRLANLVGTPIPTLN
ncbi:hypothetical protein C8P66_12816 [Humitalea rosea]|uniref:FkbM family methyltransferase n=1 Tax=Humitalea rosea TaxID=990373 RepID=A0A2W7IJC0_9PROT|nr:hypothetical protein [Humitalea rosea]PZW39437.1 hypothetical protein C8P66_12816 [Humitalea rosea]